MRAGHTRPALSWHWFFLGQTDKPAERVINADPDAWYAVGAANTPERLGAEAFADFRRAIHDPATVQPIKPTRGTAGFVR
jgi:haloacetate dehalogenase